MYDMGRHKMAIPRVYYTLVLAMISSAVLCLFNRLFLTLSYRITLGLYGAPALNLALRAQPLEPQYSARDQMGFI